MALPGYAAERSLSTTIGRYGGLRTPLSRAASGGGGHRGVGSVKPAAQIYVDGIWRCEGTVDTGPGGDLEVSCYGRVDPPLLPPPRDPLCTPRCGPWCLDGWTQCVTADCKVIRRRC
jgi:hypothetical protein